MRVAVEIWFIDLVAAPPPSMTDLDLLSTEEHARHGRYLVAEPARVFATTRIALRRLLAVRLGCSAGALQIRSDVNGKPFVVGAARPFFNVSHGDTHALIAFCESSPVGVDVERRGAAPRETHFAAAVCAATELAWWHEHDPRDGDTLVRLWTRKEAVLKAQGIGLLRPLSEIDLGDPVATEGLHVTANAVRARWCDLALPRAAIGAVAVIAGEASAIDVTIHS